MTSVLRTAAEAGYAAWGAHSLVLFPAFSSYARVAFLPRVYEDAMKTTTEERFKKTIQSPIGDITLVATESALVEICLPSFSSEASDAASTLRHRILDQAERELNEYFQGARTHFSIPLSQAGTAFQSDVWRVLIEIPFGESRSYKWLATRVSRPNATRAVGSANGRNRLPIVVPCHRVIAADGGIGGYAGGLEMKRWLLAHEARTCIQ